jgi:hypothetical protein
MLPRMLLGALLMIMPLMLMVLLERQSKNGR